MITGASTGIGRATALGFAREGAKLVLGDINEDEAQETLRQVEEAGGDALFQRTDVSVEADVQSLVAAAILRWGRIDAAFNNAGVLPPAKSLVEMEESDWDKTIGVDLKGVWL